MKKSNWIILSVIVAIAAIALITAAAANNRGAAAPVVERETIDDYTACVIAEQVVTDRLKAPSTAEFPQTCREPDTMISRDGDTWTVRSWVDAQNEFGAMLRADTTVAISYNADTEKWTVKDFQMENR